MNEAAAWAATEQNFGHSSFLDVAARYLEEAEEVADFQAIYFRGFGERNRSLAIDGYSFDDADDSLRVFIAEASMSEETPSLTFTDAKAHFGKLTALLEHAVGGKLASTIEVSSPGIRPCDRACLETSLNNQDPRLPAKRWTPQY